MFSYDYGKLATAPNALAMLQDLSLFVSVRFKGFSPNNSKITPCNSSKGSHLIVDLPANMADEFDLEALVHLEQTLASLFFCN
jgi:hypothetical protein